MAGVTHPHVDRRGEIEGSGKRHVARALHDRRALAGQQRLVESTRARNDLPVGGEPLACRNAHHHARLKQFGIDPAGRCALVDHHGALRGLRHQCIDPGARAVAHHGIERTAGEQEGEQHQRAVEPGVLAMANCFVEAQAGSHGHADGNRHVHVGRAAPQCSPCGLEKRQAAIGDRRHADQRREPVKQVARGPFRARPDAHRKQHDVHCREAGHGKRREQRPYRRDRARIALSARLRLEADGVESGDQRAGFHAARVIDADRPRGQVHPRCGNAGQFAQRPFNLAHAAGAMHARHREERVLKVRIDPDRRDHCRCWS